MYVRLFADAAGESHFEDIEVELRPVNFAPPAPALNLSMLAPASQYAFAYVPSDWDDDWHPSPRRQLRILLTGEVEDHASDGTVRRHGPGSVVLMEDLSGRGHRTRPQGDVQALVVQLPD